MLFLNLKKTKTQITLKSLRKEHRSIKSSFPLSETGFGLLTSRTWASSLGSVSFR